MKSKYNNALSSFDKTLAIDPVYRKAIFGKAITFRNLEGVPAVIEMARNGEYFGLIINRDSMEPRMCKGGVVIVKKQPDIESGYVAIVIINGDNGICKKVVKHENGLSLISFNHAYPPVFYTWQEVETLPITINGKVVELRGKF